MIVEKFPDRIIEIDQEQYLYFGGTAYLGLPTNKGFQDLVIKNILNWGTTYGSSRTANIKLKAYDEGEKFLASHIDSDSTVTVSSGMLAGKLVIDLMKKQTDCFFHFNDTHNAISIENSLPLFVNDKLNDRLLDSKREKITILTDGVPTFETKPADLSFLKQIPNHKEVTLILDESHSFGILGKNGSGIYSSIQYPVKRKIMVSSLGKAFGLTGGVIAGDFGFINEIKEMETFTSAAGMNPAFVQTLSDAAEIYTWQHIKLLDNLKYIDSILIKNNNIKFDKNYPLIYLLSKELVEKLKNEKIIIASFKYTKNAEPLNRIVITANHLKEDLDKLAAVLNS
ncbi:pyridoxal phosphate-dependent aminotransferase family protein [Flavobacterium sp. WLB]|uniref:aminotransferase class I/II-fold pyridoxal phosphate-dependent enzyme n=1 Tax=unclassified Flavobacterium TaxID=196869 RepID=UPI0006AB82A6|nr:MULTISPECIES: aminotransferase class I/II-fold pyridoxal phosphate-dependent enzyme [unclassified Flavobacterium]KOP39140.1 aminotransferase class I/II [Flavobacterium sp. VMW]OWU89201.1 aminotransferase class I/II [Flavobacterium sp. NLM]PUU68326.1 pyridoxal phosphate-dependent aminotransferase family protein [Flavobacterium sp. WLB]